MAVFFDQYYDTETGVFNVGDRVFTAVERVQTVEADGGQMITAFAGLEEGASEYHIYVLKEQRYDEFTSDYDAGDVEGLPSTLTDTGLVGRFPTLVAINDGFPSYAIAFKFTQPNGVVQARLIVESSGFASASLRNQLISTTDQTPLDPILMESDGFGNLYILTIEGPAGNPRGVLRKIDPFGNGTVLDQFSLDSDDFALDGREEGGVVVAHTFDDGNSESIRLLKFDIDGAVESAAIPVVGSGFQQFVGLKVLELQDGTVNLFYSSGISPNLVNLVLPGGNAFIATNLISNLAPPQVASGVWVDMFEAPDGDFTAIYPSNAGLIALRSKGDDPTSFQQYVYPTPGFISGTIDHFHGEDLDTGGFFVNLSSGTGTFSGVYEIGGLFTNLVQMQFENYYHGGQGVDIVLGTDGDDTIEGYADHDRLSGGDGDDLLIGGVFTVISDADADSLFGGDGDDVLFLDNLQPVESEVFNVPGFIDHGYGGAGNDIIINDVGFAVMFGQAGRDVLQGGKEAEQLDGGAGADILRGGAGNDTLKGGQGHDILNGQDGADLLIGGNGFDILRGGADNDVLDGGDLRDRLFGQGGDDLLLGGDGRDTLDGGWGNDTMTGAEWRDEFVFVGEGTEGETDVITDFGVGPDQIVIRNAPGVTSFGDLTISQAEGIAVIEYGKRVIEVTLEQTQPLDAGDFIFT